MTINRLTPVHIYDIGDPAPSCTFYVNNTGRRFWFETVVPEICERFEVSEDDVKCLEVAWGGEYNDDRAAEVITVAGEIIASFDEMITVDDVAAIKANRDNFRPKR